MIAYISISFGKKEVLRQELSAITSTLKEFSIQPLVFVDKYVFDSTQETGMMQQAMKDIDECDFLVAETSVKAIGIGIEVGYAKAKGKPIIYARRISAEHSTTISGISDYQIIYSDSVDLKNKLLKVLEPLLKK